MMRSIAHVDAIKIFCKYFSVIVLILITCEINHSFKSLVLKFLHTSIGTPTDISCKCAPQAKHRTIRKDDTYKS